MTVPNYLPATKYALSCIYVFKYVLSISNNQKSKTSIPTAVITIPTASINKILEYITSWGRYFKCLKETNFTFQVRPILKSKIQQPVILFYLVGGFSPVLSKFITTFTFDCYLYIYFTHVFFPLYLSIWRAFIIIFQNIDDVFVPRIIIYFIIPVGL